MHMIRNGQLRADGQIASSAAVLFAGGVNQFVVSGGSRPDGKFAAEPMPTKPIDQLRALRHQTFRAPCDA